MAKNDTPSPDAPAEDTPLKKGEAQDQNEPAVVPPEYYEKEQYEEPESKPTISSMQMKRSKWQQVKFWVKTHRRLTAAIVAAIILIPVLVVAFTDLRFAVMNLVSTASVEIVALDEQAQPISAASVELGAEKGTTNSQGRAVIKGKLYGSQPLKIYKESYRPLSETLKVTTSTSEQKYSLTTTGIRMNATVLDLLSGKPLKNATLTYQKSKAISDEKGQVTLVVPPGAEKVTATASLPGYNQTTVELEKSKRISVNLTAEGRVYFLSKRSGKINVMSSNLDGSDQKVVLEGTGNESDSATSLLATRDWKYLALQAKRDTAEKLYLISTNSNNTLTTIDTTPGAQFTMHGWSGSTFIYTADNLKNDYSASGNTALKGFNASTGRGFTIDESKAEDTVPYKTIRNLRQPQIVDGNLIYGRVWNTDAPGYNQEIVTATVDGQKKVLVAKSSSEVTDFDFLSYASHEVWVGEFYRSSSSVLYEYEHGKLEKVSGKTADQLYNPYPSYLLSPDGKREVTDEERDGKHVIAIRDADGEGKPTEVLAMSDYKIYGWYSGYLLLSKNDSELYILDPATVKSPKEPLKIGTYHKPQVTYRGYGYGYGGL